MSGGFNAVIEEDSKARCNISPLGDHLTDYISANHVRKAARGKTMGQQLFPVLWHPSLPLLFPISSSVWIEASRTDVSISERVSLGVSSSAKSVAHAV